MTSFNDREKGFEKKFAMDQDLRFKAESRRNKMIAEWAAEKMGVTGDDVAAYIKEVRKADFEEAGDDDVFRKVKGDLDAKGVLVSDEELRKVYGRMSGQGCWRTRVIKTTSIAMSSRMAGARLNSAFAETFRTATSLPATARGRN